MQETMLEHDKGRLKRLASECKDAKERERLRALYALSAGYSVDEVMEIFCVDESTVYRWIGRWEEERNLADKPREGRPPSLTEKDGEKIEELVRENDPKKYGMNASFWDTKELQAYFSKDDRNVSREAIRLCLKKMGARYVKADIEPTQADPKLQEEFARQFAADLAQKDDSDVFLFHDEMSAGCSPRRGYGWTFEKRLVIKAPQTRTRLNCFGAVNPLDGTVIEMSSRKSKAPALVRHLKKICRIYPNVKIRIYLDNLPVHKSDLVKKFVERDGRIQLTYLPPYSAKLNPQEYWWAYKRKKLLNNRYFHSQHQLATSMSSFCRRTSPEQIKSVCSLAPITSIIR